MSSTSISSSDSAILNAQQKTGPRGIGVGIKVGIVRGDYWGDLGLDLGRDRARIEPENNILRLQSTRVKVLLN